MVKRLRHRPFTAVTGVQIPLESSCERENEIFERHAESNVKRECADVAQFRLIDFVNKRRAVKRSLALSIEQKGEEKMNKPMWLNWQSS